MARKSIALFTSTGLLCLAGCVSLTPDNVSTNTTVPGTQLALYKVHLQIVLSTLRQTQTLPTTWDHVQLTVECRRLKAPVSLGLSTDMATLSANLSLPPGDATVSAALSNAGLPVASGSSTASLQAGTNNILIDLKTLLDFSGGVSNS